MCRNLMSVSILKWTITLRKYGKDEGANYGIRKLMYGSQEPWWKQRYAIDFHVYSVLFEYYYD